MDIPTGTELREARKERGITQAELAESAGVSQPLISRVEGGDVDPRITTLHQIAAAINDVETAGSEELLNVAVRKGLRDLRDGAGLTQAELANKAGVSQPLIARIEGENVNPRASTLRDILSVLETEAADLEDASAIDETEIEAQSVAADVDGESEILSKIATSFEGL